MLPIPPMKGNQETAIDQKHEKMGRLYWTPGYGFGTVTLNLDLCLTTLRCAETRLKTSHATGGKKNTKGSEQ